MAVSAEKLPLDFTREILDPIACRKKMPSIHQDVWLYRYTCTVPSTFAAPQTRSIQSPGAQAQGKSSEWSLSIATLGEPHSGKLSLGGFRIVPAERAALPGFDPDREAIGLACGMEEKVSWSRLMHIGGPLASERIQSIVGGKCVLLPSAGARIGEPLDKEILRFGARCLDDMEHVSGVRITTGQDLGHGLLSDGSDQSLEFLHRLFKGSILSDTSKPTAEGNYQVLLGMLKAIGKDVTAATVGLIGCGNIGKYMLQRLSEAGATVYVLESAEATRKEVKSKGFTVMSPVEKGEFLSLPLDAIAVNASGGSLDQDAVQVISKNPRLKVLCGSENLAMPDESQVKNLTIAKKVYCPTELGGMMGYLTAVEEYLCQDLGRTFDINDMFVAAKKLYDGGLNATRKVLESDFQLSFEDAIRALYS